MIEHKVDQSIVQQRMSDGYINATALCHAAGKRWHNYVRNETTGHFLRALAAKTQISVLELNQEVRDTSGVASTWVHPKVSILQDLAVDRLDAVAGDGRGQVDGDTAGWSDQDRAF